MTYLMGIDLGTSSVKTVVMNLNGKIIGIGQEDYDVSSPAPGCAEQDINQLWQATARTIRQAMAGASASPAEISGIGLSGQMHGLVLLDAHNKPVRPAIIWADQRSGKQIADIYEAVGKDIFRSRTLNSLSTGFFICSLLWVRDNEPAIFARAARAILPKDYIRFMLCGEFGTDVTDASATLIFDVARRCWASDLITRLGLPDDIFPEVGETCQVAGQTTKACNGATGLRSGTPVVFGGGDSLMHSIGNGIIRPGIISSNIGTAGQLSSAIDRPAYDRQFRTNTFCHAREDLWIIFGGHLNGGIALKWLRDNYFPQMTYRDFDLAAAAVPAGSDDSLFLPYLSGERTPWLDPKAKGIFHGMTLRHDSRHLIRSVMEGVVLSLRLSLEIMRELEIPIERIVASGGGAKSPVWLQMQADIFNAEIHTVQGREEACTGAAIAAGVGIGAFASLDEACSAIVRYNSQVTLPIPGNVPVYDRVFSRFVKLYLNNRNLSE